MPTIQHQDERETMTERMLEHNRESGGGVEKGSEAIFALAFLKWFDDWAYSIAAGGGATGAARKFRYIGVSTLASLILSIVGCAGYLFFKLQPGESFLDIFVAYLPFVLFVPVVFFGVSFAVYKLLHHGEDD